MTVQVNGLVSQELNAYPGLGGNGHYYVEYQLKLPRAEDTALDLTRRDRAARLKGLEIVEHLKQRHPAFTEAMWASSSHEMKGPVTTGLAGPTPERGIPQIHLQTKAGGTQAVAGDCFAVQAPRVYMVNQSARVPEKVRRDWSEPEEACSLGAVVAELVQTTHGVVALAPIPAAVSNESIQFKAQKQPLKFSTKELESKLSRIDAETPLHHFSLMKNNVRYDGRVDLADLMCMGSAVIPFLERKYVQSERRLSLLLAQVLAVLGSRKGVIQLVEACLADLQGDRLPTQDDTIIYKGIPPDQNAASDVAFLIFSLGLGRDEMALPVWERVVELLAHETPADIMAKDRAMYYYVTAVCYGIERLGDARSVDMLKQLHKHEAFSQGHSLSPDALEEDYVDERLAYLELLIARCLARCGSPSGYFVSNRLSVGCQGYTG